MLKCFYFTIYDKQIKNFIMQAKFTLFILSKSLIDFSGMHVKIKFNDTNKTKTNKL
jgi:hypothetical protein